MAGDAAVEEKREDSAEDEKGLSAVLIEQTEAPAPNVEIHLLKDQTHLGRAKENDIVIEDDRISRQHAIIARGKSGKYAIIDQGTKEATNIVFIPRPAQTSVLPCESYVPHELRDGDHISLAGGIVLYEFQLR
jgi:pSer/pThr/pTyr-binding forkhead associated (FHA) protein